MTSKHIPDEMTLDEYRALTKRKTTRKRGSKKQDAADHFVRNWDIFGKSAYTLTREHRFHPTRGWRLDCAFIAQRVAVEIEGGVWTNGRHTRGYGFIEDCNKYNAASELGWIVLRYAATEIKRDPIGIVQQVTRVLDSRTPTPLSRVAGANKRLRRARVRGRGC